MNATCPTCDAGPTRRYCAPARCYCAHNDCPAEWHPLPDVIEVETPAPRRGPGPRAWDNREDTSWIDKL